MRATSNNASLLTLLTLIFLLPHSGFGQNGFAHGPLPMSFALNQGQLSSEVQFVSRGAGYAVFLTHSGAVITATNPQSRTKSTVLRMKLVEAEQRAEALGLERLPGNVNYFIGNDSKQWHRDIPTYAKVRYAGVYPGIDLVYYSSEGRLEYDFVLAPGADPDIIRFALEGGDKIRIGDQGDLIMRSGSDDIRMLNPIVYQQTEGGRTPITGKYVLLDQGRVGFRIGSYDHAQPLIIDPIVTYSSLVEGNASFFGAIALDGSGSIYITGRTGRLDYPPPAGSVQPSPAGGSDAFVLKLNPAGSAIVYATYLGGSRRVEHAIMPDETGTAIAVDTSGNAYVTGGTWSTDFPTVHPIQATSRGGFEDAFVAKLNPTGSELIFSTYLGGSGDDFPSGIALDSARNVFIAGGTDSSDFPTVNAAQRVFGGSTVFGSILGTFSIGDAFVVKMNAEGTALIFSTFLGGSRGDTGSAIAVDAAGNSYVTGDTRSADFPTRNPLQSNNGGGSDAFVAKFNAAGSLVYSTYLGGSGSGANEFLTKGTFGGGIAVDTAGNTYVAGVTDSTDFPTANPVQPANAGGKDMFVAKFDANGSTLLYSTYLGGSSYEGFHSISVDRTGNAFVNGVTYSNDFPIVNPLPSTSRGAGHDDPVIVKLNADGSALTYSTYLGIGKNLSYLATYFLYNVVVDNAGHAYVSGSISPPDNFTTSIVPQSLSSSGYRMFLMKIGEPVASTAFRVPDSGGASMTTIGNSASPTVGYGVIETDGGNIPPFGFAIFGFWQNGVLVAEAAVPASALIQSGRIYAETGGRLRTGLAVANPNDSDATINFHYTNSSGADGGSGSFKLEAHRQTANFLDESPFNTLASGAFQGTFSFSSNVPVGVVAILGLTNEQNEFLITTLPVTDVTAPGEKTAVVVPHFADGGGWSTQVVLVNPTDAPLSGSVEFIEDNGAPVKITIGGQTSNTFAYAIPRQSSQKLVTSGNAVTITAGSVRVSPDSGGPAPEVLVIFSYKPGTVTLSQAGASGVRGSALRIYAENSGTPGRTGNIQTGIAITNSALTSADITLELFNLDGTEPVMTTSLSLPALGHRAAFLQDMFPNATVPNPFQGILRISMASSEISVVGLRCRYNERLDFLITTTPPVSETDAPVFGETVFPHLVDGGGYSTQFILFSRSSRDAASGTIRFVSQTGQPLGLVFR